MNFLQKLGLPQSTITFPRLRELRGKYGYTYETLTNVIGIKSHASFLRKFENGNFTIPEMNILTDHFNKLGENETVQSLFLDWILQMKKLSKGA